MEEGSNKENKSASSALLANDAVAVGTAGQAKKQIGRGKKTEQGRTGTYNWVIAPRWRRM